MICMVTHNRPHVLGFKPPVMITVFLLSIPFQTGLGDKPISSTLSVRALSPGGIEWLRLRIGGAITVLLPLCLHWHFVG